MKHCPVCTTEYPEDRRTCPEHGVLLVERRELSPGTIFRDTYRILRVLGRGGMGIVYLAEHTLLGQPRALKFLSSELVSNPAAVQRFLREAKRAAEIGLHNPNIVKTLDLGQDEHGSFFICMEYVDGPSLAALLDQAPQGLPADRAFAIARGIANGLEAAHAKGMVHRDIKPGNVLLGRTDAGAEIAKIADFGIVTGSQEDSRLTRTGLQVLTPEYAAPEQWKGVIPGHLLDGRTDLYSLGCVLFEMLTGRPPFRNAAGEDLQEQHILVTPPKPSSLRGDLVRYPGLDAMILRLMAKARENRTASIQEFLAELGAVEAERMRTGAQAVNSKPPAQPREWGGAQALNRHQDSDLHQVDQASSRLNRSLPELHATPESRARAGPSAPLSLGGYVPVEGPDDTEEAEEHPSRWEDEPQSRLPIYISLGFLAVVIVVLLVTVALMR